MSLTKSSLLFTSGTFLSRITGLLRDTVIAGVFGASWLLDAFLIANRIPNLLRDMLAEGALGSAFTKVFSSLWATDENRARRLLIDTLKLCLFITIIICTLGIVFAPLLVKMLTLLSAHSDRPPEFYTNAINLSRVLFPFLGIAILGSIVTGVLHQKGKFFYSAISPAILNLGYIIGALIYSKVLNNILPQNFTEIFANPLAIGLALGVLSGGLMQLGFQTWGIWKNFLKNAKWNLNQLPWSNDTKNVFTLMLPAAIASSAGTINLFVNTNFATSLQSGAVSYLNFSFRLIQLPVGLFGVAIGTASLPSLAKIIAKNGGKINKEASLELQHACELVLWFLIPCLIFLLCNNLPIVQIIFQHGKFDNQASYGTSSTLYAYSYCIISYGLIKVLTSFYYAIERTTYAMKVSLTSIIINLIANIILVNKYKYVGLAYAASTTLSFNALLLIAGLFKEKITLNKIRFLKTIGLLTAGFITTYFAQKIIILHLNKILINITNIHIKALIQISVNGTFIIIIFGILGIIYFNKNFLKEKLS